VEVLFLAGELGLSATAVGALLATGGLGRIFGSATAQPWADRFGDVRAIVVVLAATAPFGLLIPLTGTGLAATYYAGGAFAVGYGVAVYNVLQSTLRQHVCPPEMYGRMAASSRVLGWSAIPLGALVGGALGSTVGLRPTLWIAAVGGLLPALWLVFSPLRRLRSVSELGASDQAAVGGPAG
jgi:predicted MFS family arabinose efflux permease